MYCVAVHWHSHDQHRETARSPQVQRSPGPGWVMAPTLRSCPIRRPAIAAGFPTSGLHLNRQRVCIAHEIWPRIGIVEPVIPARSAWTGAEPEQVPRRCGECSRGRTRTHGPRETLCRPQGRRSQPGRRRALLRDAAGAPRRRRRQGRAARGRLVARARCPSTATIPRSRSQPTSASARSPRPQDRRRPRHRRALHAQGRRVPRRLPARRHRPAGLRLRRLKAINPGLVYVSISGFGQIGPLREKPAMDPILQAFTGFMSENKGPDGIPHRTPTIIIDMSTGALFASGRGRRALCQGATARPAGASTPA